MKLTNKQRLDLIRLLRKAEAPNLTVIDWFDKGKNAYEPATYQFEDNSYRFAIDVEFGELLQYLDKSSHNTWYRAASKYLQLDVNAYDNIDDCLLKYVKELNNEAVNEFVRGLVND